MIHTDRYLGWRYGIRNKIIPSLGLISLLSFFLCWSASEVEAYSFMRSPKTGRENHWRRDQFPISLQLDQNGSPNLPLASVQSAITNSINTWNSVNCSIARLQLSGVIPNLTAPAHDGKNVIKFLQTGAEWRWSELIFALTVVTTNLRTGQILDADLVFNNWRFKWGVQGNPGEADLQATATHEIGHILGLDHSTDPAAAMYARANIGETGKRNLSNDDLRGICDLYPDQPCDEGKMIGSDTVCYNGRVTTVCPRYHQLCKDCSQHSHDGCEGDFNLCLNLNSEMRCGWDCSSRSCPSGYTCRPVQNEHQVTIALNCVPDSGSCQNAPIPPCCRENDDCLPNFNCINSFCIQGKTCSPLSDPCSAEQACCGDLKCVDAGTGWRCRQSCDPLAPRCDGTMRCAPVGGSNIQGACVPPNNGGRENDTCDPVSKPCEYELGCDPQEKRCRYLCRPNQSGTCPSGYICKALGDPTKDPGLCYKESSGQSCTNTGDCPTGQVCKNLRCSPCTADSECPPRHSCLRGSCLAACTSSLDCPRQHRCEQGLCQPGVSCVSDSDCTGGLICHQSICAAPGERTCRSDADCVTGQRCIENRCQIPDACNNRCRNDELCINGKCVPRTCTSDTQCGAGFICRDSRCTEREIDCGGRGPCPSGQECHLGNCVGSLGFGCVGDEGCVPGLTCAQGGAIKLCSKICIPTDPNSCLNGFFCVKLPGIGNGCWPAARSECKPNGICTPLGEGCGCSALPTMLLPSHSLALLLMLAIITLRRRWRYRCTR